MAKNKKSDNETVSVNTNVGTMVLGWMDVQYFSRKRKTTEFTLKDNSIITALQPFEYYLEKVTGIEYLVQCNEDTVVNMHFVKIFTDGNGNELYRK
jgi:hypothetical protein